MSMDSCCASNERCLGFRFSLTIPNQPTDRIFHPTSMSLGMGILFATKPLGYDPVLSSRNGIENESEGFFPLKTEGSKRKNVKREEEGWTTGRTLESRKGGVRLGTERKGSTRSSSFAAADALPTQRDLRKRNSEGSWDFHQKKR